MKDVEPIARSILIIRFQRVILDVDLARIYGVPTGRLNEAVRRNIKRFPQDFMFELTPAEAEILKSQSVISSSGWGGRRSPPRAFTEHGAIQAANVLNSDRSVAMGVYVVRAFVELRELLSSNKELVRRFAELEARLEKRLVTHDEAIEAILTAIRELMNPVGTKSRPIGYTANL